VIVGADLGARLVFGQVEVVSCIRVCAVGVANELEHVVNHFRFHVAISSVESRSSDADANNWSICADENAEYVLSCLEDIWDWERSYLSTSGSNNCRFKGLTPG
jgi:hypothetical protein